MARPGLATGREHTGDPQIDAIWRRISEVIAALNAGPFASGRLLTEETNAIKGSGLVFSAGVTRSIPHGLGRRAQGFVETYGADVASAAHVGLRATAHPSGKTSEQYVTLTPTASGRCLLMVF